VAGIATPLSNISTTGDTLTVQFSTDISASEKTALDNNQTGPAGGFVGRSADYVQLTANSNTLLDLDVLSIASNGITSITISGQLKRGDGVSINGFGESVSLESSGLAPFNKSGTTLDGSGAFNFVVGPSFTRGSVDFMIKTTNLATREIVVSFT
jgi:hypothetical protein